MPDRTTRIQAFLENNGWHLADRTPLADDASARRYYRLSNSARRAILMDAPPGEMSVVPFLQVARHLVWLGFSAPEIYAADETGGLVILEDFGDDTYNRLLQSDPDCEAELYTLAVDVLSTLHRFSETKVILPGAPDHSGDILRDGVSQFVLHYLPQVTGQPLPAPLSEEFHALWAAALKPVFEQPKTLVLRDFHVDNLIRLDDREGVRRCGLLDFQDAAIGAGAYDLMSLLEDARRDVDENIADDMRERYFQAMNMAGPERDTFDAAYAILGAQRHTRVIGVFTRLCVRDAKPAYLVHIPRVWKMLERSLRHPALTDLKIWFDNHIPQQKRGIPPRLADQKK